MANEQSASDTEEIDYNTNLLSLGADAWDDSALIEAFNRDVKFYKQSHKNQLIDLSKVSNMISFNKAKKINQTIANKINEEQEETGYEDQDSDDDNDTKTDTILAPSFIPFANKNKNKNKKKSEHGKINKYASWPPQHINNNKKSKRKQKRNKNQMDNDNDVVETENLAKMYEEQQKRESQTQNAQQYMYGQYGYAQQQPYGYYNQNEQQQGYGQQPQYYYGQQPMYAYPTAPPQMQQMPPMPPMPPYVKSRMFNMGLNMTGQPHMSKKPNRDEALANMLLAWYWNGYYAGYQSATEHKQ